MDAALAGDEGAQVKLYKALVPVIQARVARTLRSRPWALGGRDIRAEVEDLTQDVFLHLFANDGRVLRSWDPELGLSMENFVGLIAVCRTLSSLRRRREQLPPSDDEPDKRVDPSNPELDAALREELRLLIGGLRHGLSPLGWRLCVLLLFQERSVQEVMEATGLSADAVYQWRSRLRRLARELRRELSRSGSSARKPGEDDEEDEDREE